MVFGCDFISFRCSAYRTAYGRNRQSVRHVSRISYVHSRHISCFCLWNRRRRPVNRLPMVEFFHANTTERWPAVNVAQYYCWMVLEVSERIDCMRMAWTEPVWPIIERQRQQPSVFPCDWHRNRIGRFALRHVPAELLVWHSQKYWTSPNSMSIKQKTM